jgi:hypothetical protein
MESDLFQLFAISAVTMGISHTIARERIFAPVRERLGGKDTWFGYLVSCPYCVSHYVAFILVLLTDSTFVRITPSLGPFSRLVDWFLSSILVTVLAAFLRIIFYFVDEGQGLVRRAQKKVEAETSHFSGWRGPASRNSPDHRHRPSDRPPM